jgi:2-methylcitrate dehydratase PrpD
VTTPATATLASSLAAFTSRLTTAVIPDDVAEHARLHLLDTLGCGIAASALGAGAAPQLALGAQAAPAAPGATAIGVPTALSPHDAALVNGALCHGLDFDDTHAASICHVGAVVGPATLALAETTGAGGADAIAALVGGTEVTTRIGALAAGAFHARGLHPTSVCGVFGAAAAAARILGLDAETTASALGVAGSMASGLMAFVNDGTQTKPLHAGWAAHGGVLAARLAAAGAQGPPSVLEGRFGLFPALLGREGVAPDEEQLGLGRRWETRSVAYKPYPCCHYMHGCLEAAAKALGGRRPSAAQIAAVTVVVPDGAVEIVLEPAVHKRAVRTPYEAQFSLQHSIAAMILTGRADLATYTPQAVADPAIRALATRVVYEIADFPSYPGAFPGAVRIRLTGGEEVAARVDHQQASPQRPFTSTDVRAKFASNAGLGLGDADAASIQAAVLSLDHDPPLDVTLLGRAATTSRR